MYVQAALAAASIGSSIIGGKKAKKAAKKAAKQQAKLTGITRDEEIRQKRKSAKRELGAARAGVYASNLQYGGSSKNYVNELDFENMREIAFAEYAKNKEQEAIRAGAKGAGDSLFYQAAGDAIGYAANMYGNRTLTNAAAQPDTSWGNSNGGPFDAPASLDPADY
jgi:hypothetical protein